MTLLCHFLTQTCCLWAPLVSMTVWDTAGAPHPHHYYRALWLCRMLFIYIYIWGKATLLFGHACCLFWKIWSLTFKYSVIKVVHQYTQMYLTDISGPCVIGNVSPTFLLLLASVTHWYLRCWQIPTCQMLSAVAHCALISLLIRWLLTSEYSHH